jgi:hypothetical protein
MLVYIEYISRRPGIALEHFHAVATLGQTGWADQYGQDRLLLHLGRTWRIGPEPEYLAVWLTPDSGTDRLGDWERVFASGEADTFEKPTEVVARLDRAGCYKPLLPASAHRGGRYYVEYFDVNPGFSGDDARRFFEERRASNGLELPVLVDRIGTLGPDPRGLAFWVLPDYGVLESVAREVESAAEAPISVVTSGVYAELGQEVL